MKKINRYFYIGCVNFTLINIMIILIHLLNNRQTMDIITEISIMAMIIIIEILCYFIERFLAQNNLIHIILEFISSCVVTFTIGIPLRLIDYEKVSNIAVIIGIIFITYFISFITLYISVKEDEKEINDLINRIKE